MTEPSTREELGISHPVLVGTHHKPGTEWMTSIFFEMKERYVFDLDFSYKSVFSAEVLEPGNL